MIKLCPFSQRVVSLLQQTWLIPFVRYNSPGDAWEHMIFGLNSLFFGILSLFTGNARGYTMSYYLFSRYEYSYSWVVSLCQPAGSKKFNNTKHVSRMSSQGGKQCFVYLHFTNTFVQRGGVAQWIGRRISDQGVPGSIPRRCTFRCGLEQATFTLCLVLVKPRKRWTERTDLDRL